MTNRWLLLLSINIATTGSIPACHTAPRDVGNTSVDADVVAVRANDLTRGLKLEDRTALRFDHAVRVLRSTSGRERIRHEDGVLTSGDRIEVEVRPAENAYLHLAFCTNHTLVIHPPSGGIPVRGGTFTHAPRLVADDDPGSEVLYLILSRTSTAMTAARLAAAVASAENRTLTRCDPLLPAPGPARGNDGAAYEAIAVVEYTFRHVEPARSIRRNSRHIQTGGTHVSTENTQLRGPNNFSQSVFPSAGAHD
jgi:hypothetical protein